jgi:hypothetical protein
LSILSFIEFNFSFVDSLRKDDWDATCVEAMRLRDIGKVLFYQDYDSNNEDPTKRPFVLVLHDDFMRQNAIRFSFGRSWAIDSTFKTNQYDLPLYAGIVPNQCGRGMHVFYMLCSKNTGSIQEKITLELCLNVVFEAIGNVRPTCIVIDKHKTLLLAIQKVVDEDKYCWRDELVGTEQIAGRLLLCRFHVMKAWSENLLTRVSLHLKKRCDNFCIFGCITQVKSPSTMS